MFYFYFFMDIVLTGINSSGIPHLGNYVSVIKPSIEITNTLKKKFLYFIADYHSLTKTFNANDRKESIYKIAAAWIACGLNPEKVIFYQQSQIPEIMEINWILSTVVSKNLINRGHAYKDQYINNIQKKKHSDFAITMGLYSYPILMASDILTFNANIILVGIDQIQHLEITKNIAKKFNNIYGKTFYIPKPKIDKNILLPGLDGRKMSKSYCNTIPIFIDSKKLRNTVFKIITNSQNSKEPKSIKNCNIFNIYKFLASPKEINIMKNYYLDGIGWYDAKIILYELLEKKFSSFREHYYSLISNCDYLQEILNFGSNEARKIAIPILKNVKKKIGLL